MCESDCKQSRGCHCRGGMLRGFVQPHILFHLAKHPAHGYELMEALDKTGDLASSDPGNLYRILHNLEDQGLVVSNWDTSGAGPARKVYELTEDGRSNLANWVKSLRETREKLDSFLSDYEQYFIDERKSENET
jgi:PadR family transcriptional regulator PadR